MAVNCLEIEAALKMDAAVMGTPNSRFAIPYPRSYTRASFLLMARLQPGESDLFHFANNSSTLALPDRAGDGLPVRGLRPCEDSFGAMKERITTAIMIDKQVELAILFTSRSTHHRRFPSVSLWLWQFYSCEVAFRNHRGFQCRHQDEKRPFMGCGNEG